MSSKNMRQPSDPLALQLEAYRQLLDFNKQLLARIAQLEVDLAQAQARANLSAPPIVTAEKVSAPELAFTDAGEISDQPDFAEKEDREQIAKDTKASADAENEFERLFEMVKEDIEAGHQELITKGLIGEPVSAAV